MLAWTPFLEPMNAMQSVWYLLLLPMVFGISVVYRALREKQYATYWRSVAIMSGQVVIGIVGIAVALGFFVQIVIPLLNQP
ncbi:MAG TPA: hypothetical protein EYO01_05965 [Phycisphaerales bacterium]|jgi:hypothetical protein|nr:hypothetical protein [Phycisphaerales bacterium]HIB50536.1 hypothetical protein [Phycisphaerales bacterium]HIN83903.1 hypothetical protein [Phycisphaerales bacterium]HIO53043.1 hypothetical protein [Phycisphaerales bacterium]